MTDIRIKPVGELKAAHLFDIVIDLNPRLSFGAGPVGQRVLFGAAKGSFGAAAARRGARAAAATGRCSAPMA